MKERVLLFLLLCTFSCANAQTSNYSFGVKIYGKGKPMLMIPGNNGAGETFDDLVAHYKAHYKCYVITLAGFAGQPPSSAKSDLLKRQRDEIIRYVSDKHLQKPVLVGFSFGGVLALWVATTAPDLFGPIIDIDGVPFEAAIENPHINIDSLRKADQLRYQRILTASPSYRAKKDSIRRATEYPDGFHELQKLESDSVRIMQILKWDAATDFKSSLLMNVEMDTLDLRKQVSNIRSPILVLGSWQGWDILKTKAEAEQAYRSQFTNAKRVTIAFSEQGKHFLMYEDLDWLLYQTDKFLVNR